MKITTDTSVYEALDYVQANHPETSRGDALKMFSATMLQAGKNIEFIDGGNNDYLAQVMTDLPDNCHFHKATTGCGMTSLALINDVKYVIAMPFTTLIENKMEWCKAKGINALGIASNLVDSVADIPEFTGSKIMVTYDQVPQVVSALGLDVKNWKILIDESQLLLHQASFRYKAISNLLNAYKKFGSFVFGTATPVKDVDQLFELQGIRTVEMVWNNVTDVKIDYQPIEKNLLMEVGAVCSQHQANKSLGNAHVFLNSVNSILDILKYVPDLTDVRIVCANSKYNDGVMEMYNATHKVKVRVSSISSPVKTLNFYTSTAFTGSDIYDIDGHSYIIVDGFKDNTKLDISTTLPQVIGRVRDSKFKNHVTLMFTPSVFNPSQTEEEARQDIIDRLASKGELLELLENTPNPDIKLALKNSTKGDSYFIEDDFGKPMLNTLVKQSEMANWRTLFTTYKVSSTGLCDGERRVHGTVYNYELKIGNNTAITKLLTGRKPSYAALAEMYLTCDQATKDLITGLHPSILEGYTLLGEARMQALQYNKTNINNELVAAKGFSNQKVSLVKMLGFRVGTFVSSEDIKAKLGDAYQVLGITASSKASTIVDLYNAKPTRKRVKGIPTKGYIIQSLKY